MKYWDLTKIHGVEILWCGNFERIIRHYAETVPFHKISTPWNWVKLRYFMQCNLPVISYHLVKHFFFEYINNYPKIFQKIIGMKRNLILINCLQNTNFFKLENFEMQITLLYLTDTYFRVKKLLQNSWVINNLQMNWIMTEWFVIQFREKSNWTFVYKKNDN